MTQIRQRAEGLQRRAEMLRLLRDSARAMELGEIAGVVGVHRNTARFHLEQLVSAGQVVRTGGSARGRGRPAQLFQAAPGWDPTGPRHYRVLAEALLEQLRSDTDPARSAEQAGFRWGRRLAADELPEPAGRPVIEALTAALVHLDFAPTAPDAAERIDLRHCPFQELSQAADRLVCHLHAGMLRGLLDGWRTPTRLAELEPLVEPDRCVVRLTDID